MRNVQGVTRARAALLLLLALIPGIAPAGSVALVRGSGITVVLTDEACALKENVTNLPMRATWREGQKLYEGCFGVHGELVLLYFADRTVVGVPVGAFEPVTGI